MAVTDGDRRGRRLVRLGLAAALVSRVFSRLVGIVLVVVLARVADPVTVGVYGYLLGTSSLVIGVTSVGVASIGAREVAAGRASPGGALRAALAPHGLSLLAAAALTVALTVGAGPDAVTPSALALTVGAVLAGGLNGLYAELLRGDGRVLLEGAVQMAAAVLLVAAGVLVVERGGDASDLLAVVLAKELAVLAVGVALIRPRREPGVTARTLLAQSLWLALAGTALIVLWRQGLVVAGAAGGVGALAGWVVASRYLDAGVTLAHIVGVGLRPGLAALADRPDALRPLLRRHLAGAAGAGLVAAICGAAAAPTLVRVPFGDRWPDAVTPVRLCALAAPGVLVTFVALAALVALGRTRCTALGAAGGTTAGVLLTLALLPALPVAVAAAAGTAAGAGFVAASYLVGLRDLLTCVGHRRPHPSPVPDRAEGIPS